MNNWRETTLGKVANVFTGYPFKSELYSTGDQDVRLLRGDNISQGAMDWSDARKWPAEQLNDFEEYQLKEDDIVLAMDRPWIGAGLKFSQIIKSDLPALLVQRTARLRGSNDLDIGYLKYVIGSPWFTSYIKRITTGSLVPHISLKQIRDFPVKLPPIEEQKAAAAVLLAIDKKIELNNRINAELEAMAKTLYDYWFVQFDFPDANGKPYKTSGGKMVYNPTLKREIPEGWEDASLVDIATFTNGIACQKYYPTGDEPTYKVIKIREFSSGFDDSSESVHQGVPEKVVVNDGDILFSWSATLEVKLWAGGTGALNQHIFKVTSDNYPKTFYYFEVLKYLEYFKMVAELRKTTMGHITKDHLVTSRICLPPKELIQAMDAKLSPILSKVISNSQQNAELEQLRDWLLPMLMNGQVTVGQAS
ncbi:restriction endonuclease subunit S [Proteus mirabilis]|nr:restriction endonuclease subunit S [Proteus mirabilis]